RAALSVDRHVLGCADPLEALADARHDDAHQAAPPSRGRSIVIARSTQNPSAASASESPYAPARLKFSYWSCTRSVAVSVLPSIRPETTATAPYSPRQRAVVSTTP